MIPDLVRRMIKSRFSVLVVLTLGCILEIIRITWESIFGRRPMYEHPNGIYNDDQPPMKSKFDTTIMFGSRPELNELASLDPFLEIERDWTTFNGLRAIIVRNKLLNILTGYVGVTQSSFLHGRLHDEHVPELMPYIDDITRNPLGKRSQAILLRYEPNVVSMVMVFDVINGVTHNCGGVGSKYPVESDLWWITFKCIELEIGQSGALQSIRIEPIDDFEFCIGECENLAAQIRDAEQRYREMDKSISDEIDRMLQ